MKGERLWIIGIAALLLTGCGQVDPQRPTQRKSAAPAVDSTQLALMELNQRLTVAADDQLTQIAQQEGQFVLYERGTWVKTVQWGTGEKVNSGEPCSVHMRIFSLDGKLYYDAEQTALVGKYELPAAIDENIPEWNHGAQLILLVPWYAAYGIKGTEQIPPYENIRIELEIK